MFKSCIRKRVCVIGAKESENQIKTLYDMGNLGGIVEEDLMYLSKLMNKYPNTNIYSCVQRALMDPFDAYVVTSPPETHYKICSLLINEGKNVFIENPIAHISMDIIDLVKLSEKSGSKFMVGYPVIFHPAARRMKDLLDKGVIGDLIYIQSYRLTPDVLNSNENKFWPMVENDISLLSYITGKIPVSIKASGGSYLKKKAFDTVNAVFDYEGTVNAYMFLTLVNTYNDYRVIAAGSKGTLVIQDLFKKARILKYDRKIKPVKEKFWIEDEVPTEISFQTSDPLRNALSYLLGHLDSRIDICDAKHGYETIKLLEKIKEILQSELNYQSNPQAVS